MPMIRTLSQKKPNSTTPNVGRVDRVPSFVNDVLAYYTAHGRHSLPWRRSHSAYKVMVSEIMLQQTQVDRVIPYFVRFLKQFPTPDALAQAPLFDVLIAWQGLGYNRRARMLREAAKIIVEKHGGKLPRLREELEDLPGIGPYSAGAIRAFAYNEPDVFIETNIRAVFIHHFFPSGKKVADSQLIPLIEASVSLCTTDLNKQKTEKGKRHVSSASVGSRVWYSALMDYGSHLKKLHPNPSRKSKHHAVQSKFEGSLRQARGAILRELSLGSRTEKKLNSGFDGIRFHTALRGLESERMIVRKGQSWQLAKE